MEYMPHYDQCAYARDISICEICASQVSQNHVKLSECVIGGKQGGVDEKNINKKKQLMFKKGRKSKKFEPHRNRTNDPRDPVNGPYHCTTRGCSFSNRNGFI
jgi:hypothetical protein